MYLILYKRKDTFNGEVDEYNVEASSDEAYTKKSIDRGCLVYKLDSLQRILDIEIDYTEVTC